MNVPLIRWSQLVAAALAVALLTLVACDSGSEPAATATAGTEAATVEASTTPRTNGAAGQTATAAPTVEDSASPSATTSPAAATPTATPWPTAEPDGRAATARIIAAAVPLKIWTDRESLAYTELEAGDEVPIAGATTDQPLGVAETWLQALGGGWLYYDPELIELSVRVQGLPGTSLVEPLHAIGTRTGNEVVDALIGAVERGDVDWIIEHLQYVDDGERGPTFMASYDQGQPLTPTEADAWARERFALGDVGAGDGLQVFGAVDFGEERAVTSGTVIFARYHVVVRSPNNSRWGMGIYLRTDGQIVWVQHRGSAAYELDRSRRFVLETGYLLAPRPPEFLAGTR